MMTTLQTRIVKSHAQPSQPDFRLDVSAEFSAGVTAVFGPSGSGKSTWLECIAGLQPADSGIVVLGNVKFFDSNQGIYLSPSRRKIGYMFQNAALFPHLSVRKNVEYGLAHLSATKRREEAQGMLEAFHLGHLAEKISAAISGGERQRVALARALVREPQCLLLDEPFSALDYDTKLKIMDDVLEWNRVHRIPIVLVTHALEEVLSLAKRVIALDKGCIIAEGDPHIVLSPQRERLLATLTAAPSRSSDLLS
jgi:molybdate transport system ATP-binding protein